jgi:hypothetical protein
MYGCGLQDLFNSKITDGLGGRFIGEVVKGTLLQKHQDKWTVSIESMPKLRTYKTLNTVYSIQHYLKTNSSRQERSVNARLRCGVFPLHIETGRYRGTHADRRLCKACMIHFLLHCPAYSTQCDRMLTDYQNQNNCDLTHMSDSDKLKLLLNTSVKPVARFIIQIFNIRTQTLSRQN